MKNLLGLALITLLAAFAAGCGSPDGDGASTRPAREARSGPRPVADPNRVVINIAAEPFSLDPQLSTDIPGSKVLRHLHDGLTTLDADGIPQPALAQSWEHSEDYATWTFHLRPEARWSNGDPLTAHDFVESYRRMLDPATGAQYAYNVYNYLREGRAFFENRGQGEIGARAVDDHTLVLELEAPSVIFPQLVAHPSWYAVHMPTIREHGDVWVNRPATYIGSGPFRMRETRSKDRYIAERNPHYWGADEVFFETIVFRMIADPNTEIAAFERGELDMTATVPLAELARVRQMPEYYTVPWLGIYYFAFNTQRAPMDDVALRRALSLAVPRTVIAERVTGRGETPATGFVPPSIYLEDGTDFRDLAGTLIDSTDQEANFEQARRILAEAGYGTGGRRLPRVEILYNNEAEEHARIAQVVQSVWRTQLGIEASLKAVEFRVRQALGQAGDFDVMRAGWIGDYVDPITFLDIFTTDSGNNDVGLENERFDALLAEARSETNRRRAFELMAEAERILVDEEVAVAPIYFYADPMLVRTDLVGWYRNALGDLDVSRARRAP